MPYVLDIDMQNQKLGKYSNLDLHRWAEEIYSDRPTIDDRRMISIEKDGPEIVNPLKSYLIPRLPDFITTIPSMQTVIAAGYRSQDARGGLIHPELFLIGRVKVS